MKYYKYHGLGNDYIVLDTKDLSDELTKEQVITLCHRNYGIGSDGIVLVEAENQARFNVRILNPDGSEAEVSGNGIRIVSRYLHDAKLVENESFSILVKGERHIEAKVIQPQKEITVDMGLATFNSSSVPVIGPEREVLKERIELLGEVLSYACVNVGNPHCVVFSDEDLKDQVMRFGPLLENHQRFPRRINVQFAKVIDRQNIRIEIWERGAGYTLASGSSSSAVACAAHRLGMTDSNMILHMPGGELKISLSDDYNITMTGPVTKVAEGVLAMEVFG